MKSFLDEVLVANWMKVARTLAKQFTKVFEAECAPFQYAFSTRAGTDCVGHMLRAATDADPNLTVLSVDGIGAYDHILRASMLTRLGNMPGPREILPFVRLSHARPSEYSWFDDSGQRNPMMPLLGIFKDVRFYPILNFGHFWAPLFSQCFDPIINVGHFRLLLRL